MPLEEMMKVEVEEGGDAISAMLKAYPITTWFG
jgi:hypothetical protein